MIRSPVIEYIIRYWSIWSNHWSKQARIQLSSIYGKKGVLKKVRNTYVVCTIYLGTLDKREVCTQVKAQENDDIH